MVQHELLMVVTAPLLVVGRPLVPMLWALPSPARRRVGGITRRPGLWLVWRFVSRPMVAFLVHGAAIWVWHAPALYEATLHNDYIHGFEHSCFLVTAALFWWALIHGRYGRLGYGIAVFDVDPGTPFGKTSITIRYYHAPGADKTPTPDYELFETVVLSKRRKI